MADRVSLHAETVRMQQEMETSASTLEAGLRGYSVRQGFSEMSDASATVQGGVRGAKVRQQQEAAKMVQGALRGADERRNGSRRRSQTLPATNVFIDEESEESVQRRTKCLVTLVHRTPATQRATDPERCQARLSKAQRAAYESRPIPLELVWRS